MFGVAKKARNKLLTTGGIFSALILIVFAPLFSEYASAQQVMACHTYLSDNGVMSVYYNCKVAQDLAGCTASCTGGSPGTIPHCDMVDGDLCQTFATVGVGGTFKTDSEGKVQQVSWLGKQVLNTIIGVLKYFNAGMMWLIGWAAGLFDTAIVVAMAPLHNIKAIDIGWGLTRDVANMFFIFALLIIAIATILRLESYSAKRLLVMLIVMALLTNFSLVIARTVVDASNLLGITFIRAISPVSDKIMVILDITKLNALKTDLPDRKKNPQDFGIAPDITTGLVDAGSVSWSPANPMTRVSTAQTPEDALTAELFIQLIIFVFQLIAFFIFFALAALYIIRTVALILLFVLAPFGFVFLALPATSGQAMKWWHSLFSWSMFFPISAFFLYIAVQWGFQIANFHLKGNQIVNSALAFNYIAVTVFLLASLLIARQMGIAGTSTIIGFGTSIRKRATQYAGKGARYAGYAGYRGATAPVRAVGRAAGRGAGDAAGAFLKSDAARNIAAVPILRNILKPVASAAQKRIDFADKEAQRYSKLAPEQQAMMSTSASYAAQAKIFDKLDDKKKARFIQTKTPEEQKSFAEAMKQFNLHDDVAKATGNLHSAMQILHPEQFGKMDSPPADLTTSKGMEYQRRANDHLGKLSNEQMKRMDADTIGKNAAFMKSFVKNARNFNDITNSREQINGAHELMQGIITSFKIPTVGRAWQDIAKDVAAKIRSEFNNNALAEQVERNIGMNIIMDPDSVSIRSTRGQQATQAPTP